MVNFSGSFRDSDGFIVRRENNIYRVVNYSYENDYNLLMKTGLYDKLVKEGLLIVHEEVLDIHEDDEVFRSAYKILKPEQIPFISYPYEWCFGQLKDAALLTLKIQKIALEYGMSLKDASAYNVQFLNSKPVFIDTLSFEKWDDGPWIAYGQFCRHFIAPLALMTYTDVRLSQLLRIYIDGLPLDLTSKLLPLKTYLDIWLNVHLHWQSKLQGAKASDKIVATRMNVKSLLGIVDSLEMCVNSLKWNPKGQWKDYIHDNNYSRIAMASKKKIVQTFLQRLDSKMIWDLGGNIGDFSRLLNSSVVCFDMDVSCVELNYCRHDKNVLPIVSDLTNPSSAIGWSNEERQSLIERGPADAIMVLALIHHLAITNNVPFSMIARFMSKIGSRLIVEFVSEKDSQIRKITRRSLPNYTKDNFEIAFSEYFNIRDQIKIDDSERWIYLMDKND